MNKTLRDQVMGLPVDEKIELIQDMWGSIPENKLPPVPEREIVQAEREFAAHRADPSTSLPWEDVREWLRWRRK